MLGARGLRRANVTVAGSASAEDLPGRRLREAWRTEARKTPPDARETRVSAASWIAFNPTLARADHDYETGLSSTVGLLFF
jgi:hypothetical protein